MQWGRYLAVGLGVAVLCLAVFTYLAITGSDNPLGPDPRHIIFLILLNLLVLLGLAIVVSRRALHLWLALKRGAVGSKLRRRIIQMFSLLSILPALLVSFFAALFFHFGIQAWFNQRVNTALEESVAVAESYLHEHREIIRSDAISMANELDSNVHRIMGSPKLLNQIINRQAVMRSVTEGIVIQGNRIVAQTPLSFALAFERLEPDQVERAKSGEVVVWVDDEDKIRALLRLHNLPEAYLLIGRLIDEKVLSHMDSAKGSVAEYQRLKDSISSLQVQFSLVFGIVVLLLLLAAIWYGMHFAARLVIPITRLIKAAEKVRSGDFSTKVPIDSQDDEIATLGRAFNRMTDELSTQRDALFEVNRKLDERRRFSEAVLEGVSTGIIALDVSKQVTLYNRIASALLDFPTDVKVGLEEVFERLPSLKPLLEQVEKMPEKVVQQELSYASKGKSRTLLVRIAAERFENYVESYILTFDDITELLVAQRNAAWSDVARRVAHEIKNPLTPIQLATERLKRKYGKQITEEQDSYYRYIETISRHAGDIGKMVEEFVSFARMPAPVFASQDLGDLLQKVVFSEQVAHPDIRYDVDNQVGEAVMMMDERQLGRMFGNLYKNAAEAIERKLAESPDSDETGRIVTTVRPRDEGKGIEIRIEDNGPGLPENLLHRIMEPYVTTREKGTGLGLAIAKKIAEEHGGELELHNRGSLGAEIKITFTVDSDKNVT